MITKITGLLNTVSEDDARIQVGALEYQVLVTELVRRQIQGNVGQEISLHTMHFLEGNPVQQGRMIPRLLGFLHENDMAFFELFCTVDGIGVKKAIRVIAMPVQQIADAIQRSDVKWLTTLPGIGAAMAEKIVAGLRKKVAPFALAVSEIGDGKTGKPAV
ncbi:MAG: Holliday junction branch migration protein RuvA, partial [Gemmataceae bacterium]